MLSRIILILVFILFLFGGTLSAQEPVTPPASNLVIPVSVFVRSGPANSYIEVGALYSGDQVTPLNISADRQWVLIRYRRGFGWIQRDLVLWVDAAALDLLPVLDSNITPTPRIPITNTPFVPTATPEGNYVLVTDAQSAYVRGGPGRTYLRLGQLLPGDTVDPVGRTETGDWILIRFQDTLGFDGFGWIARSLVRWEDVDSLTELPILDETSLTPTLTFTPSQTATATSTASDTPTATNTATSTSTSTETATNTATSTSTSTETATNTATSTSTSTETATNTATSTSTSTETATNTATSTSTSTETATNTATSTSTSTEAATNTATSTSTSTEAATNTATSTSTSTETATNTATSTSTSTETATNTATSTSTSTETATNTATSTSTSTETATTSVDAAAGTTAEVALVGTVAESDTPDPQPETTENVIVLPETEVPTATQIAETGLLSGDSSLEEEQRFPIEAVIAIGLIMSVLGYIWLYIQGLRSAALYRDTFVITNCPICESGSLHVESRPTRMFGIPGARRTVRCDNCRSVLRETSSRHWRYAVDRIENAEMYLRFNGKELTDADLERLGKRLMTNRRQVNEDRAQGDSPANYDDER